MKLNYTSLQHAVSPVEEGLERLERPLAMPVGVLALHGQLPCAAFAIAARARGARVGYVQTGGGALPGALSDVVDELLGRDTDRRPRHGRALLRRPPRRDHGRGRARRGRAAPGVGLRARRSWPRDPRFRVGARSRRPRRAVERACRAGARLSRGAGAAAVVRGPSRAPSRPQPPHGDRAGAAPAAGRGRGAGLGRRGHARRCGRRSAVVVTKRSRWTSSRLLDGIPPERPSGDDDGAFRDRGS